MANLITPNKSQHKYVIGIDFGHGETSAAMCPIEWEKDAGLRESNIQDIDLDRAARKKVITSSICRTTDNDIIIDDEAFEHVTDNCGIRIGFKQKPTSLDGDAEKLMIDFMKVVYSRIRQSCDELTDTNHVVYIARPSGWTDEQSKEIYKQMALKAGIPLAGLTSESRAAIFYAKGSRVNFTNEISKGAIVFDLGSSTLDFTYLTSGDKPIDYGYNLGASIIDNAILKTMILNDSRIKSFVKDYPQYLDTLRFKARKFKENAYSRREDVRTIGDFSLTSIISDSESSYESYADAFIKLRIGNLAELNDIVESTTHYMTELREALSDFKNTKIAHKTIYGVFLTGGASRMNFIRPMIAEILQIPIEKVKIDGDNPSLTISRGIAMLGATDATTYILRKELEKDMSSYAPNPQLLTKLITDFADDVAWKAWDEVRNACKDWVKHGKTTDKDELKEFIKRHINTYQSKVPSVLNQTLAKFMKDGAEDIRKKMNAIICQYEPGREITYNKSFAGLESSQIPSGIIGMSSIIKDVCESISDVVERIVWDIIITILFGLIGLAIKGIINLFRSDEDIRESKTKDIIDKKSDVITEIKTKVNNELKGNRQFKDVVSKAIETYFTEVIEYNLNQVIIPIE